MSAAEAAPPSHIGDYDVIVIGAGIIGAMIARQLSKLQGRFAVLEKAAFPGCGVSKASLSQIHLPAHSYQNVLPLSWELRPPK